MWCAKCQSDVAAEVSPDNQRVFCAMCGDILSTIDIAPNRVSTEKLDHRTKDARELLQRWSSGKVIDPFGPSIHVPVLTSNAPPVVESIPPESDVSSGSIGTTAVAESAISTPTAVRNSTAFASSASTVCPPGFLPSLNSNPAHGIEASEKACSSPELPDRLVPPLPNPLAATADSARILNAPRRSPFADAADLSSPAVRSSVNSPIAAAPNTKDFRVDAAHPADHFASGTKSPCSESIGPFASKAAPAETTQEPKRPRSWFPTWDPAVWRSEPNETGRWSVLAGQFLAYAGVLAMTAGACFVIWSYFGGPSNYAPTGWLLATAGQMLLFFGVVTLVSGGIEQTTEQVNKRIEQLGDHIIRIEQAAREMSLRSNPIPPAHFGHDQDEAVLPRSAASDYERPVIEE